MTRADDGYADADEEMAPPGVSSSDLERAESWESAAEPPGVSSSDLERAESWESAAELEHNRKLFGQTYRERHGRRHSRCISFCLDPGQRDARRCPTCYGRVETRPMDQIPGDIEPAEPRPVRARVWVWLGTVAGYVWLGITYPWRLDQARMRSLLELELAQSVLSVEITCPQCVAAEEEAMAGKMIDRALTVACPRCGAAPGEKCRDPEGNPAPGVLGHKARGDAWKEVSAAGE